MSCSGIEKDCFKQSRADLRWQKSTLLAVLFQHCDPPPRTSLHASVNTGTRYHKPQKNKSELAWPKDELGGKEKKEPNKIGKQNQRDGQESKPCIC